MKLPEFQVLMRSQAQEDKKQKYVNVSAPSLEEALRKAGMELNIPVSKLSYEVLSRGNKGFMGLGKHDVVLMAYPNKEMEEPETEHLDDMNFDFASSANHDGQIFSKISPDGVWMRISAPLGTGMRVSEAMAISTLERKTREELNRNAISKAVKKADGDWVKVATLSDHDPRQDAQLSVDITDMEMKAWLTIQRPGPSGADCSADRIIAFLEANRVVEGLNMDAISALEDNPVYNEEIQVAEGAPPKHGQDAKVVFSFETSKKIRIKEMDGGKVDFKDINNINNVVEGQVLAKLIPPERGEAGMTVTGKVLPAKDGKVKELVIGNNVKLSEDKKQAIAVSNGQVIISSDNRISVEPIYVVEGNVSLKTGGNIVFLGSVEVKGNVEDGFSVKAAGNIEVHGSIEKCDIDCEGDVIVHNGITGKNGAVIRAGGNIWSKFIENASVEAGGLVVVSEGIVNSTISCDHKVICRGKRASIVGGTIRASEEIDAKNLGSVAGVETNLEVGFDLKLKTASDEAQERLKNLQKEQADVELNLATLEKLFKAKKEQPEDKVNHYKNLQQRMPQLLREISEVQDEVQHFAKQMTELKNNGKISASGKVYPGVKIMMKDVSMPLTIKTEQKGITFVVEKGVIKSTRYAESDEDISIDRFIKD